MIPPIAAIDLTVASIAICGTVFGLPRLLPRNYVPRVSALLNETMTLIAPAEAANVYVGDYQAELAILHNQFIQMRTENHRSPGFFQQLGLLVLSGLTWRLYLLKWRIESIRRKIELAVDERQLAFPTNTNAQSTTATALPASAA